MPNLPKSLITLECRMNNITELPILPNSLLYIDCSRNYSIKLPESLPDNLKSLICYYCGLLELPQKLPESLIELDCSYNNISRLPIIMPVNLILLDFTENPNLNELPYLPHNLKNVYCNKENLNFLKNNIVNIEDYMKIQKLYYKTYVMKISKWFLDCKYNPKYKYCMKRLNLEYNELYLST